MRKFLHSVFNADKDRASMIQRFETAIEREDIESIYLDAEQLIQHFPHDDIALHQYFDAIFLLEQHRYGDYDYRKIAMELAALPLDRNLKAGPKYREASIRALTDICPRYLAQHEYHIQEAVYYLEMAASHYADFPALCDNAINTSIDMINGFAQDKPYVAAYIAATFYPEEDYMFGENIREKMQAMRQAPVFLI